MTLTLDEVKEIVRDRIREKLDQYAMSYHDIGKLDIKLTWEESSMGNVISGTYKFEFDMPSEVLPFTQGPYR